MNTYDEVVQGRAALKMYGQIAGQAVIKLQEGNVHSDAETYAASDNGDGVDSANEKVRQLYMEMFGQRSPKDHCTSIKDLNRKVLQVEPQDRGKYALPFS